jgi:diketogulonate reductase-like aldo/keto reductase
MSVVVANEARIPSLGYGTYGMRRNDMLRMIPHVLRAGFRHIDTAQMYGNEAEVGEGWVASGVSRQEILRWLVQQDGVVALSRTLHEERASQNLEIFDFSLDGEEMAAIHALAEPKSRIVDPPGLAPLWDPTDQGALRTTM